jgi:fucose permease
MLALCFGAFVCFGVVLILVGAHQHDLARDLGLDLERSGLLGSALALGLGLGVVGAGPLFDRQPRRPLFLASTLLAAIALLAVDRGMGFARALLHLFAVGVGVGVYDTLINALVVERFGVRSARPMAVVHAGVPVGAMLGPLALGALAHSLDWSASFRLAGAAHLGVALWALGVSLPDPTRGAGRPALPGLRSVLASRALLPFALVAFAYVGVESALTLFAIPFAREALGLGDTRGRLAISALWGGLFAGRLGVLALPRAPGEGALRAAGVLGAALLAAGAWLAAAPPELLFGAVGLALGCVYPVMIALAGQGFPGARGTAAGLAAGAGALGGFAVPWLTGALADARGAPLAVASLSLWCVAIALAAARRRGSAW